MTNWKTEVNIRGYAALLDVPPDATSAPKVD